MSNAEAAKLTKTLLLDRQRRHFAPLSNAFPSSGTECSSRGSCRFNNTVPEKTSSHRSRRGELESVAKVKRRF